MSVLSQMIREHKKGKSLLAPDVERFFPEIVLSPNPKIGVVIGTYAAVPYVVLQLEARKLYWPEVAVLVHDDSSQCQEELRAVCQQYGADFVSTPYRLAATVGDMSAFMAGLNWGKENDLDIIVKLSRRYILYHNWVPGLQKLSYNTQYATYGNSCVYYDYPLRSECIGMNVAVWHASRAVGELRQIVSTNIPPPEIMEKWYHALCCQIHMEYAPTAVRKYEKLFLRHPRAGGFGIWHMMGYSRHSRVPGILWDDIHSPLDYWLMADSWGLKNYKLEDFEDPNMGQA